MAFCANMKKKKKRRFFGAVSGHVSFVDCLHFTKPLFIQLWLTRKVPQLSAPDFFEILWTAR